MKLSALFSVSVSHLDAESELKKFFGSKAVTAAQAATSTSSPGKKRRGMQPQTQRSQLTRPQPSWGMIKQREGLSARPLTVEETTRKVNQGPAGPGKWWTVEYSKRYKGFTMTFMEAVMTGGRCIYVFRSISSHDNPRCRSRGTLAGITRYALACRYPASTRRSLSSSRRSAHPDFCMFVLTHMCNSQNTVKRSTTCPELCTHMSAPSSARSVSRAGITDSILIGWRIDRSSLPSTDRLCELTQKFFCQQTLMLRLEICNVAVVPGQHSNMHGCLSPLNPCRTPMVSTCTLTIYASKQGWVIGCWTCGQSITARLLETLTSTWIRACCLDGHTQEP